MSRFQIIDSKVAQAPAQQSANPDHLKHVMPDSPGGTSMYSDIYTSWTRCKNRIYSWGIVLGCMLYCVAVIAVIFAPTVWIVYRVITR